MANDMHEEMTTEAVYAILEENLEYIGWSPLSPQERTYIIQHVDPFPSTAIATYDLFVRLVHRRLASNAMLSPPDWARLETLAPDGALPPESLSPRLDRSFTIGFGANRSRLQRVRLNPCQTKKKEDEPS